MVLSLPVLNSHRRGFDQGRRHAKACFCRRPVPLLLPPSLGHSQPDVTRRLTPIRHRSQRLNIFFVFNRPARQTWFAASHIAARGFSPGHAKALVHSFLCHSARFGYREKCRDELQRHHARKKMGTARNGMRGDDGEGAATTGRSRRNECDEQWQKAVNHRAAGSADTANSYRRACAPAMNRAAQKLLPWASKIPITMPTWNRPAGARADSPARFSRHTLAETSWRRPTMRSMLRAVAIVGRATTSDPGNMPHQSLEFVAPRSAGESEKILRNGVVTLGMTSAEAK